MGSNNIQLGFPRDVSGQTGTGRPVVPLSRDKKKFLSRCPFVPGQGQKQMCRDKLFCPGTSRDKITPKKPGKRRSKTEKGHSKTGKWCPKTENPFIHFVPGHLLLPLSRDKGTPGQEFFFVPGQRDNGTSRPVETLPHSTLISSFIDPMQNFVIYLNWSKINYSTQTKSFLNALPRSQTLNCT